MVLRTVCPRPWQLGLLSRTHLLSRAHQQPQRYSSSDSKKNDSKAFAKSLLLPKTTFPLWADAKEVEGRYRDLTCDQLYNWQKENSKGPLFVFHDGPPYANGDLHMGHALNKVLKDIINRFQLLMGRRVHYVPGWDCHGLPIENKTLKELNTSASQLPPEKIREAARATALREVDSQKDQFRPLGVMADWNSAQNTYRTLDHDYEIRQLRIFQQMVAKGLIYRHYRPVHYSPSSMSALAEAELVYKDDHVSHSVFVTFDLDMQAPGISDNLRLIGSSHPKVKLLVWTTTPWTLTANMGIAIHSDLTYALVKASDDATYIIAQDRLDYVSEMIGPVEVISTISGADLINASYTPIFSSLPSAATRPLKVIHSSHVTSDSGTCLVHCAPAHGPEDYHAFKALSLISDPNSILCHVGRAGEYISTVAEVVGEQAAGTLVGKPVLKDGGKAAVDLLREVGQLVKVKRIKHRYPYDWKTDEPVIVTATSQWFANLDSIKADALNALAEVNFFPALSRNRLESFTRSRSEWCISRQRVWGVPIPALYEVSTDKAILDAASLDHILGILSEKGVSYWWSGPVEEFLPPSVLAKAKEEHPGRDLGELFRKGTDTMDVWFDSGTSWSMLPEMGVGKSTEWDGMKRPFHADICLEGSDQHRGWFQSQLLTSIGSHSGADGSKPAAPYGTLITHGMVLDEKGRKMSKSLGNIISPLTVINGGKVGVPSDDTTWQDIDRASFLQDKKKQPAYGADILRLWAASVEYWRDMSIGPTILSQTAESYRKIRNSARFALGNIDGVEGRPVIEKVPKEKLGLTALDGYATYNFPKVVNALTNFSNITLSSLYFDITKDCLYANKVDSVERRAVVTLLNHILHSLSKIMAPVLPHLAEEIHATWKNDGKSVFMTPWTPLGPEWQDPEAAQRMGQYLQLRTAALSLLEQARGKKCVQPYTALRGTYSDAVNRQIRSSLEAGVDIIIPDEAPMGDEFVAMLQSEGAVFLPVDILKTLFIVSDATITSPGGLGTSSPEWAYMDTVDVSGSPVDIAIRVRPAGLEKCPRCWTYTREEDHTLCPRCTEAVPEVLQAN
ncbi:isoleucyl-tRNA synthetase [Coprinopsis cinerea okayama7|uniref:Isoleucine--tRNA ligase, mitochondrial n=1 Tax=Coprinopsis cinerea (strain Okayama-7 / 130 / ATCC MYA-4618 / FGSC 9003) TaxID=240176 RepID=A8PCD8_COPC7|nr:isoleucyl-tRNA synthetase [Coprinopsis cinerea okayama7\|eukprot:XP_001840372.2 isoleucyl-tRNA synthetase [Coprinopsis cinerea okayama7\